LDIKDLMGQLQGALSSLNEQQKLNREKTFVASSGDGAVEVEVDGGHNIKKLVIAKKAMELGDADMLSDLVKVALNQAFAEVNKLNDQSLQKVTGGLKIPGLF
jgi:nucleoid-associated protein EbfC